MPEDNNSAATKQDLRDFEARLTEKLTEAMGHMQTELLRGFAAFSEG